MPLRDETMSPFARAHSRTKQASVVGGDSRMCGVEEGEPISSSGLATNVDPLERQPRPAAIERRERVEPGEQPDFMSVTPGPCAIPSRRSRTAARRPCPGRTPCPCGR